MIKKKQVLSTLRELLIVFTGVFAAFLLNDFRHGQIVSKKEKAVYKVVFEDLDSFYSNGTRSNENGFITMFEKMADQTEAMIQNKEIPLGFNIVGDYWNVEIINSMVLSGKLNDIDPEIFKYVSRFHTVHSNMLGHIQGFNRFYEDQVVPNLDKGVEEFYYLEKGGLKLRYQRMLYYQDMMIELAESSVELSKDLKEKIKSKYLK